MAVADRMRGARFPQVGHDAGAFARAIACVASKSPQPEQWYS
jgi:hypothetical protein